MDLHFLGSAGVIRLEINRDMKKFFRFKGVEAKLRTTARIDLQKKPLVTSDLYGYPSQFPDAM